MDDQLATAPGKTKIYLIHWPKEREGTKGKTVIYKTLWYIEN